MTIDENTIESSKRVVIIFSRYDSLNINAVCCSYVAPIFLSFRSLETYWQSNGTTPHLINIHFVQKVRMYLSGCKLFNYGASR